MQAVIPRPDVAPLLEEHFIVVAADADDPTPGVDELLSKLKNANMLPIVILADAAGQFLAGKSGGLDPDKLKELLNETVAAKG